jgi:type I restriction enzyme S subunit
MSEKFIPLGDFGEVIMGLSPKGTTYNENGKGLPLLNGPTEFGDSHPSPTLYTIDSKRESNVGDLIFCVRGSTTGRMNWSDQIYSLGRGVCAIRGENRIDTKYIKYSLDNKLQTLLAVAGGGTFPNLKKDDIKSFKIPVHPNYPKIVKILSAYDNLIENNLKRVQLLEEAAQNLYKEWFVNFRFPGSENKPLNKETGLPEGWISLRFEEVLKIIKGKKPKIELEKEIPGSVPYLLIDVLERKANRFAENEKLRLTESDETLMVMDGSRSGIVLKSIGGAIGSTLAVMRITDEQIGKQFCYQFFKLKESEIISKNTGAAIPHANKSYILNMEINVPNEKMMKEFEHIVGRQSFQIQNLHNQNVKLKEARDLLLPRLMNRTIEV